MGFIALVVLPVLSLQFVSPNVLLQRQALLTQQLFLRQRQRHLAHRWRSAYPLASRLLCASIFQRIRQNVGQLRRLKKSRAPGILGRQNFGIPRVSPLPPGVFSPAYYRNRARVGKSESKLRAKAQADYDAAVAAAKVTRAKAEAEAVKAAEHMVAGAQSALDQISFIVDQAYNSSLASTLSKKKTKLEQDYADALDYCG